MTLAVASIVCLSVACGLQMILLWAAAGEVAELQDRGAFWKDEAEHYKTVRDRLLLRCDLWREHYETLAGQIDDVKPFDVDAIVQAAERRIEAELREQIGAGS